MKRIVLRTAAVLALACAPLALAQPAPSLEARLAAIERTAQSAKDRGEVDNLFSRYMYLHNAFQDRQIVSLWAKEGTPGMAAEYSNLGRYTTYASIMGYHLNRPSPTGKLIFHYLASPLIEIAGDGQTAKGMWIMTGLESGLTKPEYAKNLPGWMHVPQVTVDGKQVWMHRVYAKYGVDFIKQDGQWKIWHFRCFEVVREPYGKGWIPWAAEADAEGFNSDLMYIGDDGHPMFMPKPDGPALTKANPYRINGAQTLDARLPEPYHTFADTFSY